MSSGLQLVTRFIVGLTPPGFSRLDAVRKSQSVFDAADLILTSLEKAIGSKKVTYDFARLMDGATQVSCSGFGQVMIDQM